MSDEMATTVLTVGPDGSVSAVFSGEVSATALSMPEGVGVEEAPKPNAVRWLSKGTPVEALYGTKAFGLTKPLIPDEHSLVAQVFSAVAGLWESRAILVGDGSSDFLQVLRGAGGSNATRPFARRVNFGVLTVEWAGASAFANPSLVTHGLGIKPVFLAMLPRSIAGSMVQVNQQGELGLETFEPVVFASAIVPPAGTKTEIHWIAIG